MVSTSSVRSGRCCALALRAHSKRNKNAHLACDIRMSLKRSRTDFLKMNLQADCSGTGDTASTQSRERRHLACAPGRRLCYSFSSNMETKPLLIGGNWRTTDHLQEVRSPFNGETLARVSYASRGDVEEAIAIARS